MVAPSRSFPVPQIVQGSCYHVAADQQLPRVWGKTDSNPPGTRHAQPGAAAGVQACWDAAAGRADVAYPCLGCTTGGLLVPTAVATLVFTRAPVAGVSCTRLYPVMSQLLRAVSLSGALLSCLSSKLVWWPLISLFQPANTWEVLSLSSGMQAVCDTLSAAGCKGCASPVDVCEDKYS